MARGLGSIACALCEPLESGWQGVGKDVSLVFRGWAAGTCMGALMSPPYLTLCCQAPSSGGGREGGAAGRRDRGRRSAGG